MIAPPAKGSPLRGRCTGQAVAEFAIAVPIVLLLVMILFDFGRVVYAQNAITEGARAATRLASVSAPQSDATIRDRARIMPPGVPFPDEAITGDGGSFYPSGTAAGSRVVVHIELEIPILTPIVSSVVGGSMTVAATSEDVVR
ncbi:MAG TPA: TadE/TadG family type IV pilus assembly protein [Candidatus Eisenbacteria bacterium]|nr:TadE/TadG family type IV pilus assembly protein [Candidatus Eisenbacteria bacterium]